MAADALEDMLGCLPRHRFADQIPPALRPWLLPIDWDRERLWELELPRQRIALKLLRWHLALPWWRRDDAWFQISPYEVMARPSCYPEHAERVASADLTYPLHVVRRRQRWLILDGVHRLTRAELLGDADIYVFALTAEDIAAIAQHAA